MSSLEEQRLARERGKVVQTQTQPTVPIVTGAEQVGQPKIPEITVKVADIKITRNQKIRNENTKIIQQNLANAAASLSTINKNIELLSDNPHSFTIIDSVTGERRQTRGSDIDDLKAAKADWTKYVTDIAVLVKGAPIKSMVPTTKVVDITGALNQAQIDLAQVKSDYKSLDVSKSKIEAAQKKIDQITVDLQKKNITTEKIKEAQKKIEKIKKEITKSTPSITQPVPGKKTIIDLTETADKLYQEAGYTQKTGLGQKSVKPTLNQLKARLGLLIIEPIIGGAEESLYGTGLQVYSQSAGRPGTAVFRIAGGLGITTPMDLIANFALTKLAITERGRRLIKKLTDNTPDPMWDNVAIAAKRNRRFESVGGKSGLTTAEIRESFTPIKRFLESVDDSGIKTVTRKMLDDAKRAVDTIDTAALLKDLRRKQGLIPDITAEDLRTLEKINKIDNVKDFTTADLRNAERAFKRFKFGVDKLKEPLLTAGEKKFFETQVGASGQSIEDVRYALTRQSNLKKKLEILSEYYKNNPGAARLVEVIEDLSEFDDPYEIRDVINFVKDNPMFSNGEIISAVIPTLSNKDAKKLLEETTNLSKDAIDNVIEQLRKPAPKPIEDDVTDIVPVDDTEEEPVPVPPKEIQEQEPDQPDPTKPKPPEPILDEPVPEEVIPEEPTSDDPTPTPTLKLSEKEKKERRKLNLQLFAGKKQLYRVNYQYKGGRKETIGPLEARSLPDALGKAQRIRSGNKTLPTVIKVTFIGEKRK